VSAPRTARRLLRLYPAAWRTRYADELEGLILDMSDGRRVPWRVRADVAVAGVRERVRLIGGRGGESPEGRVRSGAVLVLWAWALFVLGGAVLQKTSEHWQQALPARSASAAHVAFTALIVVAVLAALLVVVGIGLAIPGLLGVARATHWPAIRRRLRHAGLATLVFLAVTLGLVIWAHGLTGRQRAGHDTAYALGFVVWALLGAGALLAWTAAAAGSAAALRLRRPAWRAEAWLSAAVAAAMAVMTVAAVVWWVVVADASPSALTGSSAGHPSALVLQLVLAVVLMLAGTGLGAAGTRRATGALPALADS
jgi:hypothetical protein